VKNSGRKRNHEINKIEKGEDNPAGMISCGLAWIQLKLSLVEILQKGKPYRKKYSQRNLKSLKQITDKGFALMGIGHARNFL
jgi:hypothetical protein